MADYVVVGNDTLSWDLARELKTQMIEVKSIKFPDSELKPTIDRDLIVASKNKRALIVCRTDRFSPRPNDSILEIGFIASTLRRYGIEKIDLLLPYMFYCRQDREVLAGESESFADTADVLEHWNFSNIFTLNSHLYGKKPCLQDFFRKAKVHDISAASLFSAYLETRELRRPIVLGPGKGPEKMAVELAELLHCDYECLGKNRNHKTGAVSMEKPKSDLKSRDVIIYDDISASGGTIAEIFGLAKELMPKRIFLVLVHLLTHDGIERLGKLGANEIITTDSFISGQKEFTELPILPLISKFISLKL
jgi:ribose-phosphate pyrophosphokinase